MLYDFTYMRTVQAGQFESAMKKVFPETNQLLQQVQDMDTQVSGSTGVVALLAPGHKLVVANLGDSRCLMGAWVLVVVCLCACVRVGGMLA